MRQPDALFMTMFIPIFFLVVNTGQAAEIFPSESTDFLEGQGYGAFQLPITLLLAASFGMAALFLVEEIEGGYFDKLRAIPIPRYSIVLGRLVAEGAKGIVISSVIVLIALPFGIKIASGPLGFVLLVALSALWGVVYAGFMQLIALKTRSAAATNSGGLIFFPLLFLTPNFVPRDLLTEPMEVAATLNPVTYLMEALRSLILVDLDWEKILPGFAVVARARRGDARAQRPDDQELRLSGRAGARRRANGVVAAGSHRLDLDQPFGPAEDGHAEQRGRRPLGAEELLDDPPRRHKIGVVAGCDVDGRLDHVLRSAARSVERDDQVVERLASLRLDVARTDRLSVRIERAGPGREHRVRGPIAA